MTRMLAVGTWVALAVALVSGRADACEFSAASAVADCTSLNLSFSGIKVPYGNAVWIDVQIDVASSSPTTITRRIDVGASEINPDGTFSVSQALLWSDLGVSLEGVVGLSGTATLWAVWDGTLQDQAAIAFAPQTLNCPCSGVIGDFVWLDSNANGLQDESAAGLGGVQLSLTGPGISTTAFTDANGHYLFRDLCPADYTVSVIPPAGYTLSPQEVGTDRAVDSNPNPSPVSLTVASPVDLTQDFGLHCAGTIGDFVWLDSNGNGLQDLGEPGIPGVALDLRVGGATIASTVTDANGRYAFDNLCPGSYQVVASTPAGYVSTTPNAGPVDIDSNPNPSDVTLTLPAQSDLTVDFGFVVPPPVCTGTIGDFVWQDSNGDGLQQQGEPGIGDVAVSLHAGSTTGPVLATTITAANGFYQFSDLCAGSYVVVVDTPPPGYLPSPCGDGSAATIDNNCSPAPVTLPANDSHDDTIDFGYVPVCSLGLEKTCEIVQPPGPEWTSCKGKIQRFTMIWPESQGAIQISGIPNDAPGGVVNPGQRVTFSGPFSVNDLYLDVSGAVTGRSSFHVSCSDADMDGLTSTNLEQQQLPGKTQDCGKFEGNGKRLAGTWINSWLLDGLVDAEGKVLNCSPAAPEPTSSCAFQMAPAPSCGTGGTYKPATLTFQYTGGGCATQSNNQAVGKTSCTGNIDPSLPVNVTFPGGTASNVPPGGTFTMPRTQTQSLITLTNAGGTESDSIHTSCSQPLAVGDVYFSLTLVAEDGVGAGEEVKYSYAVTNNGVVSMAGISVIDDKLGVVPGSPIASLAPGQTTVLTASALLAETTTNVATASAPMCPNAVTDSATVTVVPPPACTVAERLASLADDKIVYAVTNTSSGMVTLDTLTLNFPTSRVQIREVRLDGTIYKSDSSTLVVAPGVTIGSTDWTNPDITKRQLNPGETRNLEIFFKVKAKATAADFSGTATFSEGCGLSL